MVFELFQKLHLKIDEVYSWHHKFFHFYLSFSIWKASKGRKKKTKIWISWERSELFRWNKKQYLQFLKSHHLVKKQKFDKNYWTWALSYNNNTINKSTLKLKLSQQNIKQKSHVIQGFLDLEAIYNQYRQYGSKYKPSIQTPVQISLCTKILNFKFSLDKCNNRTKM